MRATWTDERLDDLTERMDDGFERVDKDLREMRRELREGLASARGDSNQQVGSLREEMQAQGAEINARFDSMQRVIIQFGGSMIVAFVGLIVAVVLRGG